MDARRALLVLGASAAGLGTLPAPAGVAQDRDRGATSSQALFERMLLRDRRTAGRVRSLLRRGGGFVNPQVRFKDLTRDERVDAVVRVASGGSAGDVALYVFSTHGARDGRLRAVYRNQSLYRVRVTLRSRLFYIVPRYEAGDELCCPARFLERSIRWDRRRKRFRQASSREYPAARVPADQPSG